MSSKLAEYAYQKYMLNIELKEHIKYINNSFLILLDNPLTSIRNKALECIKETLERYISNPKETQNEYGESVIEWIEERLELLTCSKNASTRYNALDIISCIIKSTGSNVSKFNLEDHINLLLERLHDISPRVRKKAIDIVCNILESLNFSSSDTFITQNGLHIWVDLLNSVIAKKDEVKRVAWRLVQFLSKILFEKDCFLLIPIKKKGKVKYKKSDTYSIVEFIYSHIIVADDEWIIDGVIAQVLAHKYKGQLLSLEDGTKSAIKPVKGKALKSYHDKDITKIIRLAIRDLVDTRKAVYINIINSFIQNDIEISDDIFEIFKVLDDKVRILI